MQGRDGWLTAHIRVLLTDQALHNEWPRCVPVEVVQGH